MGQRPTRSIQVHPIACWAVHSVKGAAAVPSRSGWGGDAVLAVGEELHVAVVGRLGDSPDLISSTSRAIIDGDTSTSGTGGSNQVLQTSLRLFRQFQSVVNLPTIGLQQVLGERLHVQVEFYEKSRPRGQSPPGFSFSLGWDGTFLGREGRQSCGSYIALLCLGVLSYLISSTPVYSGWMLGPVNV